MKINVDAQQRGERKVLWNIHGLRGQDKITNSIQTHSNLPAAQLIALSSIKALKDITWKNCATFIVPDFNNDNFNFTALAAIWQGIPTLVSAESGVGKLTLNLPTPSNTRPILYLTGDPVVDEEKWIEKLHSEILNETANPMEWAKQLSLCLREEALKWEINCR